MNEYINNIRIHIMIIICYFKIQNIFSSDYYIIKFKIQTTNHENENSRV
jgi:low affinity Fe/Cu permease